MEQLSIFSFLHDDEDVQFWSAEDFCRLWRKDADRFREALRKRGVREKLIAHLLAEGLPDRPDAIEACRIVIEWSEKKIPPFIRGDMAANENELVQAARKLDLSDNSFIGRTLEKVIKDLLADWGGVAHVPQSHRDWRKLDLDQWLVEVEERLSFLDKVRELGAEKVHQQDVQPGDVLLLGTTKTGVVVDKGSRPNDSWLFVWLGEWESGEIDADPYVRWVSQDPLLADLVHRKVIRVYHRMVYRLQQKEVIPDTVSKDRVLEDLKGLPLPDTPRELWEMYRDQQYDTWLHHIYWREQSEALHFHMTRYPLRHVVKFLEHEEKTYHTKRNKPFDHLPPDSMIHPLVEELRQATTLEEVDEVLKRYWWVESSITTMGLCHRIYRLDGEACRTWIGSLYRGGMTQTGDSALIIRMLMQLARNGVMWQSSENVAWSQDHGLFILPEPKDPELAQKLFEELSEGVFLGQVWDRCCHSATAEKEEG